MANDTLVFDVVSNRLYAPLDPFLELRDIEGHLLGSAMEGYDRDPHLVYTFKTAGDSYLSLSTAALDGSPAWPLAADFE